METRQCREAIEHLLAYVEDPDRQGASVDAAIHHVQTCSYCQDRLGHLVRGLSTDQEDRLTCGTCQDLLPEYLEAEMLGQAGDNRWQHVVLHLEMCPNCSEIYANLSDLNALAFGERGKDPPDYPVPDLSFLAQEPSPLAWRLDDLGRLIIEFSSDLLRACQASSRRPAQAAAQVKSAQTPRILYEYALEVVVRDLAVKIVVEAGREREAGCTIIVTVDIPSRGGWPNLVGTEVIIKRGENELDKQHTNAFGQAVFKDIAVDDLAHLVFEIEPQNDPGEGTGRQRS